MTWPTSRNVLHLSSSTNSSQVAQVGLAILGLTFSVDSQSTIATTRNGTVQTPDLSQIYPELHSTANSGTIGAQQYAANKYAVLLLSLNADKRKSNADPLTALAL